jgi:archaellum component FlaF (FlaF/FlaG flagellin family)
MRSLVVAGLLAGSMLVMTGCFDTDDVEEALGIKENVVWVVNGYQTEDITAHSEGDSKVMTPGYLQPFVNTESGDTFNLYYEVQGANKGSVDLATDKVHAYVATDCNTEGYIKHAVDSQHLVQVINVGKNMIANDQYTITIDGTPVNVTESGPCARTPLNVSSTTGHVVVERVGDGEKWEEDLTKDYAFDVIVREDGNVTVAPLLGFEDVL